MIFRTTGAIATLLIGLGGPGGQALAQYYPPPQTYPPQAYPPPQGYPPRQPLPPVADADAPLLNAPVTQSHPLPPVGVGPQANEPPAGPGPVDPSVTGSTQGGDPRTMAAFPPDVRPETGPKRQLPPQFRRTLVDYYTKEPAGTLIIDTPNTYLYLVLGNGKALRYGVGVGREGFTWSGAERVTKMAEWPDWNPPEEMIVRQPYLPRFMAGGETNPLGARALYLGNTIYRIHGTNQPSTIGTFVSSGCIRLTNEDVTDLYTRVKVGTRVVVLPGKPPATAAATLAPPAPAPAGASVPHGGGQPLMQLAAAQPQGEAVAKFRAACGQDFRRFCTGVQPGGGRILQCLRARRDELSAPCQSFFVEEWARAQQAAQKNTPTSAPPGPHPSAMAR
jgi:lipoprotein-anchoring transpeptidase ErfK/SrfK